MRKALLLPVLVLVAFGCGKIVPDANPEAVEVTGRVTQGGKAISDVTLTLQPTGTGTQATLPVKDGNVKGTVTPGKYTYYITEGAKAAAYKSIPEGYRAGSMDRQIEIKAGTTLDIKLD